VPITTTREEITNPHWTQIMRFAGDLGWNKAVPIFREYGFTTWPGADALMGMHQAEGLVLMRQLELARGEKDG